MDRYDLRRIALRRLVDGLGHGGIAAIAEQIGKAPNYVSRMLYEPWKPGRKRIGEETWDALVAAYPTLTTPSPTAPGGVATNRPSWTTRSPQHARLAESIDRATCAGSLSPDDAKHLAGLIDKLEKPRPGPTPIADAIRKKVKHADRSIS